MTNQQSNQQPDLPLDQPIQPTNPVHTAMPVGRPSLSSINKRRSLTIRLHPATLKELIECANIRQVSKSSLVETLIKTGLSTTTNTTASPLNIKE